MMDVSKKPYKAITKRIRKYLYQNKNEKRIYCICCMQLRILNATKNICN